MLEQGYIIRAGFMVYEPNNAELKDFTMPINLTNFFFKKTADKKIEDCGTYFGMSFLKEFDVGPEACLYLKTIEKKPEMVPLVLKHKESQAKAKADAKAAKERAERLAELVRQQEEANKKAAERAAEIAKLMAGN